MGNTASRTVEVTYNEPAAEMGLLIPIIIVVAVAAGAGAGVFLWMRKRK